MASVPVPARLMSRRRQVLAEHLPGALESALTGVHQARVASRRLRELIPILGDVLPLRKRRRLLGRLKKLTRALGVVRELDVSLATIDQLAAAQEEPRPALAILRARLVHQREAQGAWLAHRYGGGRGDRLLARLARVESASTDAAAAQGWRRVLAERICRRAHALRAALADAGALFDAERLHRVRIAVKKLRYALEVAGEARAASTGTLVRKLKDVQDILGRLHDLDILLAQLREVPEHEIAELGDAQRGALAAIEWLHRELTAEARRLHARYLRRQPALVGVADAALDSVAPRVEAIESEPLRPPSVVAEGR
jgi:CHAD domain-containing protein